MERWYGKVAVVTGASYGIGAAIAEKLVENGLIVVGLARSVEMIKENSKTLINKPGKLYGVKADITKEEEIINAFQWILENVGRVHILVNNAGIVVSSSLMDGPSDAWDTMWKTNVMGLCIATSEAIKIMRAGNIDGHIVHINSIDGHTAFGFPNASLYGGTKFAVTNATEHLRKELVAANSKIKVTSISPGYVNTTFSDKLGKEIEEILGSSPALDCVDIANAVIYAVSTPPHVQVHEMIIKPVGEKF